MARTPTQRILIRRNLLRLLFELRGGGSDPTNEEFAKQAGLPEGFVSVVCARPPRQTATLKQLGRLSGALLVGPWSLLDRETDPGLLEHAGVCWRLAGDTASVREQGVRVAAAGAALGWPPSRIAERIGRLRRSRDDRAKPPAEDTLPALARGGLNLGLVTLVESDAGAELLDEGLSESLTAGLRRIAPRGIEPTARVVRNVAHPGFARDPVAPHLIARVAHRWVASCFAARPAAFRLGIAGGLHLDAFVHATGPASSPIALGDERGLTLVPLTREPLYEHRHLLADALVGELSSRLAVQLAPHRVEAPSFLAFGSIRGDGIRFEHDEIGALRKHYPQLDVAVFGCGDDDDDGWLKLAVRMLNLQLDARPLTDVCLNLLTEDAQPIALRGSKGLFEFLGVRLRDVQGVAEARGKLALLLTSGAAKGVPLTVVVRAGCANGVICDQAAARSALEALASR